MIKKTNISNKTIQLGAHLSSSKGYLAMANDALSIGANTFAFFTRNPRGGKAKAINKNDISSFNQICKQRKIKHFVAHGAYTLNLASNNESVRDFSKQTIKDDLNRLEYTPNQFLNIHPGSHVGQGIHNGIDLIANGLNEVINQDQSTTILLETMSGKGSEVGSRFEELKELIDKIDRKDHIGICFDTCHLWDSGYDIVNNLDGVIKDFDRIVGLEYLQAIHINDSYNSLGSHKDRHARIGEGKIGANALAKVVHHSALMGLCCILETPNKLSGWAKEIAFLLTYT